MAKRKRTQENPFIHSKLLEEWRSAAKGLIPIKPKEDISQLAKEWKVPAPVGPVPDFLGALSVAKVHWMDPKAAKGHMMTEDGRLVLRIILDEEAKEKFGAEGLTHREAIQLLHRLGNLHVYESLMLECQRDHVILRRALQDLYDAGSAGRLPTAKELQAAGRALHLTKTENPDV